MRIIAGNQVVEDFDNYNRVHHMFSKMMSEGARKTKRMKVSVTVLTTKLKLWLMTIIRD